jgi:NAD+ diphosphatase
MADVSTGGQALAGAAPSVPYAGLGLDRALDRREDPAWAAALMTDPRTRIRPLWRDECLVAGEPPLPLVLKAGALDGADSGQLVLLGLDDDTPEFAVDLSDLTLADALAATGADAVADIRSLFASLPAPEAGILAYARGLLHWSRYQRYCGRCGSEAAARNAGLVRACTNADCGTLIFPRIAPAVIALVETITSPARCLLARHRASKVGGYSLLAGFVEIGESLEDAVHREIFEEAGITLHDVSYLGSQPWPFPAGLMVGFRATAVDESVSVDGNEILEARWFTRDELTEYGRSKGGLGRIDSIDRIMLTAWLAEGES